MSVTRQELESCARLLGHTETWSGTPVVNVEPGIVRAPEWQGWAKWMSKTHRQKRCPDCKKYMIWVPKTKKAKEAKP